MRVTNLLLWICIKKKKKTPEICLVCWFNQPVHLGGVCFFRCKRSAVCGPHLQVSAGEEVDQRSAVCKEKREISYFSDLISNRSVTDINAVRIERNGNQIVVEHDLLVRVSSGYSEIKPRVEFIR
ncbi:hypothetical protein Hanom_Chr07g00633701 [Helianthus anomalus]